MIEFGFKDAWKEFERKYPLFVERFPNLLNAAQVPMAATIRLRSLSDRVVFFLAATVIENFWEILLLCGNGYGRGAMALIRGMYERAVTAYYLSQSPEETDNFVDYYWVAQHKLARAVQEVFGADSLPADNVLKTETNYNAVKARFEVTACPTCQTTRLNHTWSKLDFVAMAKKTPLAGLIVTAYLFPTQQAHGTIRSMLSYVEETAPNKFAFVSGEGQDTEVTTTLVTAHNVCLSTLILLRDQFHLSALDGPIELCFKDFAEIWKTDRGTPTNSR